MPEYQFLRSPRPLTSTSMTSSPNLQILFHGTMMSLPPLKIEVIPHCPGTTIASTFPQVTVLIITSHMQPSRLPSQRLTTSFWRKSVYRSLIIMPPVGDHVIFHCMQINLFSCLRQYNQSAMCHKESALHILLHCSTVNRQYGPVFLRPAAMQKRKAVLLCGSRILLRCPYGRGEPWRKHTGHILRLCIKAAAPGILCKTRCILILFSKASI